MKKIKLKLENCYGIGSFDHTFDFSNTNTFLLYAPNGTMKSSFAKTVSYLGDRKSEAPSDRLYPKREALCEIEIDDQKIEQDVSVLVVDPDDVDHDSSDKISAFLASKELKKRYDNIYTELDEKRYAFLKKLKVVSKSADCEAELISAFQENDGESFYELLERACSQITEKSETFDFRYNDIFDKKGNVKKFLLKNEEFLKQYITSYKSLLSKSSFFSDSDNSFGTYQASQILTSISDNSFFAAGHALQLSDEKTITSSEALASLVQQEIDGIVSDEGLKEIFTKVDKAIGANVELRAFKTVIEKDNLLLVKLDNYEKFRKEVWVGYLKQIETETRELSDFFSKKKTDLKEIVDAAKQELDTWKNLIKTFNNRFHVPFEVSLSNHEDVILKQDSAVLIFNYKDREEPAVECDKASLLKILSKGEQRAHYILQLLFDIESKRVDGKPSLLVLDDIADSFDYKNKYDVTPSFPPAGIRAEPHCCA